MDKTHKLGVREVFLAGCSVDTLNPQCAEIVLFIFAVTVSVGKTFFPSIFGNGPHILTGTIVTTGEF